MNDNKLFSIVIPTYKGEDSLPFALMSIFRQTYKNIEVIVADDNEINSIHQKKTIEIVNKFSNSINVKRVYEDHVNGSHARNIGIKAAKGEYIALLDDDDYYLPEYVEMFIKEFERDKQVDFIFCDVAISTKEGVNRTVSNSSINSMELLFGDKEIGTGSNICFRKNIKKEKGFDERYSRFQDIEFIVKKLNNHKSKWIHKELIVKYFNKTDNYLNYEKTLLMHKLLRDDVKTELKLDNSKMKLLEIKQMHSLYNDMLVKNSPVEDIKCIKNKLIKMDSFSFADGCLFQTYCMSKTLFNLIFSIYKGINKSRNQNSKMENLLEYRSELEENWLLICGGDKK